MIRVLHDLSALDGGGDAKLLYSYYSNMDREKVHFDFIVYDFYDNGMLEDPLREMGSSIYHIPRIRRDIKGYLKGMEKVIAEGNYDVVHSHMGGRGLFAMYFAKKHGVKRRFVHSHVAYEPVSKLKRCFDIMLAKTAAFFATDLFACGVEAGKYMWGKKAVNRGKVKIMTNAIDTKTFAFDPLMREEKRHELGVDNQFVVGIVGRLETQKNYPYLVKVWEKVVEQKKDVVLVAVGRGPDEEAIKGQAKELGILKHMKFLGIRDDVPKLLNAFDAFVLPSLFEGLPVVLVEAQANGLFQLVSEKVTDEIEITDLVTFLPIGEEDCQKWADHIVDLSEKAIPREQYAKAVADAGYDIRVEASKMCNIYCSV
ncbi:MAG: glycosyltransferase family 1 protein [Lachnospiraceae bacterium]|nr:glycosyltransferase family 1 protein [Lachnospiraceae bacterium]